MSQNKRRFIIDRRPMMVLILERLRRQLWLGLVFGVFALVITQSPPDGLTHAGWSTLCIFGLCVVLWATSLLPLAVTSLLAMAFIPLFDVMEASQAYRYFGSKVVFFILGAFMLSAALTTSGLSKRVATLIVERYGRTPRQLILAVFFMSALGATVMSSHAVAAMVFPIVVDIARALKLRPLRSKMGMALFFALAWGCIIGGSLTILGGGRGPLAIGLLEEATLDATSGLNQTIGFTEYILYGAPMVLLMLGVGAYILVRHFKPEIDSTDAARVELAQKLHRMGKITIKERVVGLVVLVTIALWVFMGDRLGIANIAICSVGLLFVLGTISWREVEDNINWGVIIMYGGAICLGGAMDASGAALWLTGLVMNVTDSPAVLMLIIVILSAGLTEFMSNSAVIAMLMPPALALAEAHGVDVKAMTMAVVLPSNFAFMFPVSTPVTAIAWSAGYYTPGKVASTGLILHGFGLVCMCLLILWWWPSLGLV
jgi:sodium-dependent dicarboxylate transporter 2/3/5